jgi:hypothetical protein
MQGVSPFALSSASIATLRYPRDIPRMEMTKCMVISEHRPNGTAMQA